MPPLRIQQSALTPVAFQRSSLSNSTAIAVNSTVRTAKATVLHISVETNNVRYRGDATAPTLTTGVLLLATNSPYWVEGDNGTSLLRFQRSTGTATVNIMGYKRSV